MASQESAGREGTRPAPVSICAGGSGKTSGGAGPHYRTGKAARRMWRMASGWETPPWPLRGGRLAKYAGLRATLVQWLIARAGRGTAVASPLGEADSSLTGEGGGLIKIEHSKQL